MLTFLVDQFELLRTFLDYVGKGGKEEFLEIYPLFSSVEFLELGISDHSPAVIKIFPHENSGPKPFKFLIGGLKMRFFFLWLEPVGEWKFWGILFKNFIRS